MVAEPAADPILELVFESQDPVAIGLAKAALEDAAIPFVADEDETAARLTLASPLMFPLCRIAVKAEDAAAAREVLIALTSEDSDDS